VLALLAAKQLHVVWRVGFNNCTYPLILEWPLPLKQRYVVGRVGCPRCNIFHAHTVTRVEPSSVTKLYIVVVLAHMLGLGVH
jgi:hypothetical protein